MVAYTKPWMSFKDQIVGLKKQGMIFTDEAIAEDYLSKIGYYRLSAYWYPLFQFQESNDGNTKVKTDFFCKNTHFEDAVKIYIFDKNLRISALDALERIETAIKVDLSYTLGERNTYAHTDITELHPSFANKKENNSRLTNFERWQRKYESLISRSREVFITHHFQNYTNSLPIWKAVEILDFGATSRLFEMIKVKDKEAIALKYGITDWIVFESWLRALNYLRNICAHHSRLWNRNIIDQPRLPNEQDVAWSSEFIGNEKLISRSFLLLSITSHMIQKICPNTEWHYRLADMFIDFPHLESNAHISLDDIGAPKEWLNWWA